MKSLILIDGHNLAYRAHHVHSKFRHNGQPTSILYGVPSMIYSLIKKYPGCEIRVFWDGMKHFKRQELLRGNYKGHRAKKLDSTRDDLLQQIPFVKMLVGYMGITQITNVKFEADDLIYKYHRMKRRKNPERKIIIVSTDKDFLQLVSENTYVYHGIKDLEIRPGNILQYYPYKAKECVAFLALTGDKTDDIPGVGGIGETRAREILNKVKPKELFANPTKYLKPEQAEILKRNQMLIDLALFDKTHGFKVEWKDVVFKSEFHRGKYLSLCAKYGLKRFSTETFYKALV